MKSFITGSHAYGTPREDSDVDLVVFAEEGVLGTLFDGCDTISRVEADQYGNCSHGAQFRFGKLNLIAITDLGLFQVWKDGTERLKTLAPVKREDACAYLKAKRDELWAKK